jgi:CRP-like cAMP-binding protein
MKSLFPFQRHRFNNEVILDELPDDVLDVLLKNQEIIHFKKGEIVFKEGVRPQGVYYVKKGKVKRFTTGFEGREYMFYISGERELLGHHGLLNDETNPNSAETLEDSELIFLPKRNFLQALELSRDLQIKVMRNLSHEFGVFVHFTKILAQYSVREKTALALLIVNEKYLSGGSLDAVIELSREELASMVGTVKESLVRVLREFKDEGVIATKGRGIVIKDFDALIRTSNYFD